MQKVYWVITLLLVGLPGAPAYAQVDSSSDDGANEELSEVIVTGVFTKKSLEKAAVAVSVVSEDTLSRSGLVSAADLLKNVPGVFVNSGYGEIRNIVHSRGVSAGAIEASNGYFYVSMQEDGMPVTNVRLTNYGPDFFLRADTTIAHIEALRGGTATITAANAPGGVFNYITKNGRSHEGGTVGFRYGLEGDGEHPYYRLEGFVGGELGDSGNLYYGVGGFYRESDGAHYPGYKLNKGGQLRGNLLWDYGDGELLLTGKYLGDDNLFFEFIPTVDFNNPRVAPGLDANDSFQPPAAPHTWRAPDGSTASWDARNTTQNEQLSLALRWNHELGNDWTLDLDTRINDNTSDWNTGAVIFAMPLTDNFIYILGNTFGQAGTYQFRDPATGDLLAETVTANGRPPFTVTVNNLPNQDILQNGVFTQIAFDPLYEVDERMARIAVSKTAGDHAFTLGGFYADSDVMQRFDGGGIGYSGLQDRPFLYDVTLTRPGGEVVQITSPEGFGSLGDALSGGRVYDGSQEQLSLFFGHTWQFTDSTDLDWGVRYESIDYDTRNTNGVPPPNFGDTTVGGEDGDPLTWYDNFPNVQTQPVSVKRSYDYLSYSFSLNHVWNESLSSYVRYSDGKKAPSFGSLTGLLNQAQVDNIVALELDLQQIEIGLKYSGGRLNAAVFPFYAELDNVTTGQIFTDENGNSYSPPPPPATITTYGVEFDANFFLTPELTIDAALTLQESESEGYAQWQANTPGPSDDVLVTVPDGDADNAANVLGRVRFLYDPTDELSLDLDWDYVGSRPANRFNAFDMPGFSLVNLGATYRIGDNLRVRGEVKNLLNEDTGVLSWSRSGGFLASLNRQGLTPEAVASDPGGLYSAVYAQLRAYFVTLTVDF